MPRGLPKQPCFHQTLLVVTCSVSAHKNRQRDSATFNFSQGPSASSDLVPVTRDPRDFVANASTLRGEYSWIHDTQIGLADPASNLIRARPVAKVHDSLAPQIAQSKQNREEGSAASESLDPETQVYGDESRCRGSLRNPPSASIEPLGIFRRNIPAKYPRYREILIREPSVSNWPELGEFPRRFISASPVEISPRQFLGMHNSREVTS